jgi:hypothetical protein
MGDPPSLRPPYYRTMNAFVIIFGSVGLLGAYILGLWLYGIHIRQVQLEELADLFRRDQEKFNLFFYNIAIKMTKREIAQQQNEDV